MTEPTHDFAAALYLVMRLKRKYGKAWRDHVEVSPVGSYPSKKASFSFDDSADDYEELMRDFNSSDTRDILSAQDSVRDIIYSHDFHGTAS